jgi:glycerophosphoryl diester phosphodiesterase
MKSINRDNRSILLGKLLSHRLRGYAKREQSPQSLQAIGVHEVAYIELDTRVDRDGTIYIHHSPAFIDASGRRRLLAQTTGGEIARLIGTAGELATLRQAVEAFARSGRREQKLCLDIKDIGFEKGHLELVRETGIEARTIFVSWAPQVLLNLRRIGCAAPLILSCWHLARLQWLGRLVSGMLRRSAFQLGHFVVLGSERVADGLPGLAIGFQYALVTDALPDVLIDLLAHSGGGICIHTTMLGRPVIEMCRAYGLQLWVFSAGNTDEFVRLAGQSGVDVVFCDDVPTVARDLRK